MMTPESSCCPSLSTTPLSCAFAAPRFLLGVEDAKLRGAYIDPAAGRQGELRGVGRALVQDDRWPEPSMRHTYRQLLDYQILPTFEKATLAGRATRMP